MYTHIKTRSTARGGESIHNLKAEKTLNLRVLSVIVLNRGKKKLEFIIIVVFSVLMYGLGYMEGAKSEMRIIALTKEQERRRTAKS